MERERLKFPGAGTLHATGRAHRQFARVSLNNRLAAILLPIPLMLAACSSEDAPPAPDAAPALTAVARPTATQAAARMQECRTKLEAGIPPGLVINASVDNGRPILWVGPAWKTSTRQEKESLARAAACFFLSGDESKPVKFSIYEQSSDREIAVWNLSRLVEW